jgi:uncharacterized protein YabE (DUF348 family)
MKRKSEHLIARFLAKELHKHPFAVIVFTFCALSVITLFAIVMTGAHSQDSGDSHVVQLTVDGEKTTLPTRAVTVGNFLDRVNVKLNDGDVVEPSPETVIDAEDFRINVYRAKPVTIIDGNKRTQAFSAATTPRSIAAQVGVSVHPEDKIEFAEAHVALRDQALGTELVIDRAIPVRLILYGTPVTVRTHVTFVRELLQEKNIILAATDTLSLSPDAVLQEGMEIQVNRRGTKIATKKVRIDNEIQYVDDDSLSFGTTAVRQAGSPGKKLVTYQIILKNGKEIKRKLIQEVVTQKPVPRIVARGKAVSIPSDKKAIMAAAGLSPSEYPYAQYIINHENGLWCPTRWQGQYHCPPYYEPIHSPSDPSIGYGLCQSTPADKMATAGDDWKTNVVTQMKWCDGYAIRTYGSWQRAYDEWTRRARETGRGWW